jgi:hypothetical protein
VTWCGWSWTTTRARRAMRHDACAGAAGHRNFVISDQAILSVGQINSDYQKSCQALK